MMNDSKPTLRDIEHVHGRETKLASDGMPLARWVCSCGKKSDVFYRDSNEEFIHASFARHVMLASAPHGYESVLDVAATQTVYPVARYEGAGVKWFAVEIPKGTSADFDKNFPRLVLLDGAVYGYDGCNPFEGRAWFNTSRGDCPREAV